MKEMRITPIAQTKPIVLPLFISRVKMGFPSPAADYYQDPIDLNEILIKNPSATFLVEAEGDSMYPVIRNKAMLVIDRSIIPCNNHIVLAYVNGEFTVKQYKVEGNKVTLVPANKRYTPMVILDGMDFMIWGVVYKIIQDPIMP